VTTPIGTIGTIGAATSHGRRQTTAPTCHDLAEMIESDPATVWTWGDREGPQASRPASSMVPVTPSPDHKRREILFFTLKSSEAPE